MSIENIRFSYNWNNKLHCQAFTTLRLHNPRKYQVGKKLDIYLREKTKWTFIAQGEIKEIKTFKASKINDFIAFLDTGYNREECLKIIQRMYKTEDPEMDFILIVKDKKKA